jgi:hypothetical protein
MIPPTASVIWVVTVSAACARDAGAGAGEVEARLTIFNAPGSFRWDAARGPMPHRNNIVKTLTTKVNHAKGVSQKVITTTQGQKFPMIFNSMAHKDDNWDQFSKFDRQDLPLDRLR